MTLDSQLNYKLHVNRMVSNVSGKLKQLRRMRSFLDTRAAVLVYKSMMLPLLEYGDIFLSATTIEKRNKLQVLQNKGLRCALNKDARECSDDIHEEAKIHKLKFRREQHLLNFMYDWSLDSTKWKVKSGSAMQTRSHKKRLLYTKRKQTEKFKKSFAYKGPNKWNCLSEDFHQAGCKGHYKLLVNAMINGKSLNQTYQNQSQQNLGQDRDQEGIG